MRVRPWRAGWGALLPLAPLALALCLVATVPTAASAYQPPGRTLHVSLPDGVGAQEPVAPNGASMGASLSADGRYVAFASTDPTLVPNDTNDQADVFVRDTWTDRTERVSVASDGTQADDWSAFYIILWDAPKISADGRYVVFLSGATNLVPGDTNGTADAFVHDRLTGTTTRVNVATDGTQGDTGAQETAISADGRYAAFGSADTNLVPGDTNGTSDVFVHDMQTGVTTRVSTATDGTQGNAESRIPSISGEGRYVVFQSDADTLVANDTNGKVHRTAGRDVFLHDTATGTTSRVSVATDGSQANSLSQFPQISADGSAVVFLSYAANLVPNDTNASADVFVRDLVHGTTERVSLGLAGNEAQPAENDAPSISGDGRYVAYESLADNAVPGDTNNDDDVFFTDRATGDVQRVSLASDGTQADGGAMDPAVSADGRSVAYEDLATNLAPGLDQACQAEGTTCWEIYERKVGPELGVGGVQVDVGAAQLDVGGWARLDDTTVASASDPGDDGSAQAAPAGGELTGADVLFRPEAQDLLVRMNVTALPGFRPGVNPWPDAPIDKDFFWCGSCSLVSLSGVPDVRYGFAFSVGSTAYQVVAQRQPDGSDSTMPFVPSFELDRCDPTCAKVATLKGGLGARNDHLVEISVPLSAIGATGGEALTGLRAFTDLLVGSTQVEAFDSAALADATIPVAGLSIGVSGASAGTDAVPSWTPVALTAGTFDVAIDRPSGPARVWLRACSADRCSSSFVPFAG